MTRKDIIIIAALVNAGLLAIIFMMAINTDDDKASDVALEIVQPVAENKPAEITLENSVVSIAPTPSNPSVDEVDNALQGFAAETQLNPSISTAEEIIVDQDEDLPVQVPESKPVEEAPPETPSNIKYIEVTVKKGDSLDKIARSNGTTVPAIKEANKLKNDRLDIGQVLRIPVSTAPKKKSTPTAKPSAKADSTKNVAQNEVQYYTVKSGDNPWKIAKQFHLKVDELLQLNNLNEEKARNLKIGDKLRVK